jgi:ABC-2 type transport system ATP-binding protein
MKRNMNYAIETVNLIKRYPTSVKREGGGFWGGPGRGGAVGSFVNLFGIFKNYKGPFIEALRGVNLQIKKGEIFGLLGPNGAGKTTLIKILCTLVIHDEGLVTINGFDVKKEPSRVLQNLQAVLPESRGFTWRLSGRENLKFYALLYGLEGKPAKDRIDYLLDITGLKDRAEDDYQRYSTGMQRKLLLCRALLRDTPVLLFDEPTAGLDPASALEFRRLLRDRLARQEGKTILLSTHNLPEAQDICDRIAILDRGKITACDTPRKIQYALSDEKEFRVTFIEAIYSSIFENVVKELGHIPGVHEVLPDIDDKKNLLAITIRVDKDMALSGILESIVKTGMQIGAINTQEPSLEDVFATMTRRNRGARRDRT